MDKQNLLNMYRQMLLIRVFEDKAAEMYAKAKIGGFLHLYNGQEAVATGVVAALREDDELVTHYRDHGYALCRGVSANAIMAELFGRQDGCTGGRGGSMHLVGVDKHFWGGYAIVGAHLPLAAGLAYAAQYQNTGRVTLCMFGDGSTTIGTFHAALSWSKLWNLPIIWLVENNKYAMGTAYDTHSSISMLTKAKGYDIPAESVDGMNAMQVYDAVSRAAERARSGGGPTLLDVDTYRYRGHSMADSDVQRSKSEIEAWKKRDPIHIFEQDVIFRQGLASPQDLEEMHASVEAEVEASVAFADASPEPARDTLYHHLYSQPVENMQIDGSLIKPPTLYQNGFSKS